MFDLPEAKRVRREDLNGSEGSQSGDEAQDAELRARLEAQIARSLGFDEGPSQPQRVAKAEALPILEDDNEAGEEDEVEPEEFDFALFNTVGSKTKVVLEEDILAGDGGFAQPRPLSQFLTTNLSQSQKDEFAFAAVSPEDLIERSHQRCWGLELPWKVTHVTVTKKVGTPESIDPEKRRRPGKKRRIAARMKERKVKDREVERKKKEEETEESLKNKKKRSNRAKKLRKRAKKKEERDGQVGESGDESESD